MQKHLLRNRADGLRCCVLNSRPSPLNCSGEGPFAKTKGTSVFVALYGGPVGNVTVAPHRRERVGCAWTTAASPTRLWSYGDISLCSESCAVEAEPVRSPGWAVFVCCAPVWRQGVGNRPR